MAATEWCTNCQAEVIVESDAAYDGELTCPNCQQSLAASDVLPDQGLDLADIDPNAVAEDLFAEFPLVDAGTTTLQPTQVPLAASPTPREKIGPDGLTDSQRCYDLIVRIIGYSIIGVTVIVWIIVGLRPHEGMSPLYGWIPGSFPVLLMGLLIGIYGAVFGDEARRARRSSLIVTGASLAVLLVLGAAVMLAPEDAKPRASHVIAAMFFFGAAGVALCLGLAGLLTGQSFWKILSEMGQRH